jgi:hypothetical protein
MRLASWRAAQPHDPAHARDGVLGVHRIRDRAGGAADAVRARDQRDDGRRRSRRLIFDEHAVTTTVGDQVLAQQQAGRRIEEADVLVVPLHTDGAADPAGRRGVVRAADLDEAVEVDGALGEGVVAKGLDRQRAQVRVRVPAHREHPDRSIVNTENGAS